MKQKSFYTKTFMQNLDSNDESHNRINIAVPVSFTSEMQKMNKSMDSYSDRHSHDKMNKTMDDPKKFEGNMVLKKTF